MRFRPGKGAKLLTQRYFTSKNRILSLSKVSVRFLLVYILSTKVNASSALFTGAAAWVRGRAAVRGQQHLVLLWT